jgi:hypothetical protein
MPRIRLRKRRDVADADDVATRVRGKEPAGNRRETYVVFALPGGAVIIRRRMSPSSCLVSFMTSTCSVVMVVVVRIVCSLLLPLAR